MSGLFESSKDSYTQQLEALENMNQVEADSISQGLMAGEEKSNYDYIWDFVQNLRKERETFQPTGAVAPMIYPEINNLDVERFEEAVRGMNPVYMRDMVEGIEDARNIRLANAQSRDSSPRPKLRPESRMVDTEEGTLTNPEPLYEMAKEIDPGTIETKEIGLMSKPKAKTNFVDTALDTILKSEGGFQNDKEDTGNYRPDGTLIGTNRGITPAALAEYKGVDPNSITVEDIKGIDEKTARAIYRQNYFEKPKLNKLPSELQETVFDMYINAGGNAIKILQKLVGTKEDGVLGPKTLKALEEKGITKDEYADARIEYYKKVVEKNPQKKKYLKGWINRANKYRD